MSSTSITDRAAQVLAEIDAALALAEKATPGPWKVSDNNTDIEADQPAFPGVRDSTGELLVDIFGTSETVKADSAFIAASRTLLPTSLQIIRDDIKAWLELRDSLQVGRDDVRTWDFCNRRLTAILDAWRAAQ